MTRLLILIVLLLVTLSVSSCKRDAKSQLVGKWEATLTHKRSGNVVKELGEFLPDGTSPRLLCKTQPR